MKKRRSKRTLSLSLGALSRDFAVPHTWQPLSKIKRFNNMIQGAAAIGTLRSGGSRYIKIIAATDRPAIDFDRLKYIEK